MRIFKINILLNLAYKSLYNYPVPVNLNYLWNFGVIGGILLAMQLFTGIFLASHYISDSMIAFSSIQHIMRDVNSGWLSKK